MPKRIYNQRPLKVEQVKYYMEETLGKGKYDHLTDLLNGKKHCTIDIWIEDIKEQTHYTQNKYKGA